MDTIEEYEKKHVKRICGEWVEDETYKINDSVGEANTNIRYVWGEIVGIGEEEWGIKFWRVITRVWRIE